MSAPSPTSSVMPTRTSAESHPPFPFIVGCGRSGTTLLRAMLDSHPDMAVPPESYFVGALAPRAGSPPFDAAAFIDDVLGRPRFELWQLDPVAVRAAVLADPTPDFATAVRRVFECYAPPQ